MASCKKRNIENSLREVVYFYLCQEMKKGRLSPDQYINQASICQELNISKAPLRDALIQLETEGFITILPRRGALINPLTLRDIKEAYSVLGALESEAVRLAFDFLKESHLKQMESLNKKMIQALDSGKFAEYYLLNGNFHNVFLDLAENELIKKLVGPIKQRLYDFPLRSYNIEWEKANIAEHARFIETIRKGNREGAASIMKHEHWSFPVQKKFILEFYKS